MLVMSGIDLGVRIFFGVLMLLIFLFHLYWLIYAWHHLDAEDFYKMNSDIKYYRQKKRESLNKAINEDLWGE